MCRDSSFSSVTPLSLVQLGLLFVYATSKLDQGAVDGEEWIMATSLLFSPVRLMRVFLLPPNLASANWFPLIYVESRGELLRSSLPGTYFHHYFLIKWHSIPLILLQLLRLESKASMNWNQLSTSTPPPSRQWWSFI